MEEVSVFVPPGEKSEICDGREIRRPGGEVLPGCTIPAHPCILPASSLSQPPLICPPGVYILVYKYLGLPRLLSAAMSVTFRKMTIQDFEQKPDEVSISPLLQRLAYPAESLPVDAADIAAAFALIFEDRLSAVQTAALLTLLHSTARDKDPEVIAKCSQRMRDAALQPDRSTLKQTLKARAKKEGKYNGGLVSST